MEFELNSKKGYRKDPLQRAAQQLQVTVFTINMADDYFCNAIKPSIPRPVSDMYFTAHNLTVTFDKLHLYFTSTPNALEMELQLCTLN